VLTTYRKDGSAHTVPVWYRWTGGAFEVVIATGDVKLRHLARDPRCVLVVFEAVRPFRGVEVRRVAELVEGDVASERVAIAGRYLGLEDGERFAADRRCRPGVLLRLVADGPRVWACRESCHPDRLWTAPTLELHFRRSEGPCGPPADGPTCLVEQVATGMRGQANHEGDPQAPVQESLPVHGLPHVRQVLAHPGQHVPTIPLPEIRQPVLAWGALVVSERGWSVLGSRSLGHGGTS
jgi:hypothetical protein